MDEYGQNQVLDLWESGQSDPEVQFALGQCYLRGAGVEQSGAEAEKWLRRAAEQGHEEAAALLRSVVEKPQPSREALTLDTLPDWCEAAEKGEAQAQYEIAAYFLNHPDPAWDSDVERYLSMAVEQEHPQACLLRGEMLLPGQPEQAVKLLRSAAEGGELRAMVLLGECYAQGKGVEQDLAQAEAWFVAAARRGSGEDMLKLALRYRTGDGVPRSQGRGLSWLRRAQRAGVDDAEARYYGEDWSRRQKAKERCVHRRRIRAGAEAGEPGAQRELGDLCLEELKSGSRRRSAAGAQRSGFGGRRNRGLPRPRGSWDMSTSMECVSHRTGPGRRSGTVGRRSRGTSGPRERWPSAAGTGRAWSRARKRGSPGWSGRQSKRTLRQCGSWPGIAGSDRTTHKAGSGACPGCGGWLRAEMRTPKRSW